MQRTNKFLFYFFDPFLEPESATIPPLSEEAFELDASECNAIKFLEHIQVRGRS